MKYWIMINGQQMGPMDVSEACNMGINPNTPVWAEGMPDWIAAKDVPEFASLFIQQPPQQSYQQTAYQQPYGQPYGQNPFPAEPCPPTNLVWAILTTLFCCLPFGIVSIVYASKVESNYNMGNLELARQNSKKAGTWALVSALSAVVVGILYGILMVVGIAAGAAGF